MRRGLIDKNFIQLAEGILTGFKLICFSKLESRRLIFFLSPSSMCVPKSGMILKLCFVQTGTGQDSDQTEKHHRDASTCQ